MSMMANGPVAANPYAYVEALSGWQRERVEMLRTAIHAAGAFDESIKWTNLLFSANGQCLVIRAEENRVLLAMFRGKRLTHLDPRIKPGGKYELANLVMTAETEVDPALVTRIAAEAAGLNAELGDPTKTN
jgi:hypothetical protein